MKFVSHTDPSWCHILKQNLVNIDSNIVQLPHVTKPLAVRIVAH